MTYVRCITNACFGLLFLFIFSAFLSPVSAAGTGILTVITTSINDNGGNWRPSDFSIAVKQNEVNVSNSPQAGVDGLGKSYTLNPGIYTVLAGPYEKYTNTYSGDCDSHGKVNVTEGTTKTCLIVGNDVSPNIHVIVNVINDNGGTAVPSDFKVHVKSNNLDVTGSPTSGTGLTGTLFPLPYGTYVVSEEENPRYTQTITGDCDASGSITTTIIGDKTCVITNNDTSVLAPRLPNTGSTSSSEKMPAQICINTNNLFWIVSGILLSFIIHSFLKLKYKKL